MRTALALVAVLAMLVAARAKPLECVLWPKACQEPAPIPANPAPPVPAPRPAPSAPKVDTGRPMPRGPVAVQHKPKPKVAKKAKRAVKPKPAPARRVVVNDGRDLSSGECTKIRLAGIVGNTIDDVKAAARARGITMTAKQIEQATACLAGKR